MFFLKGKLTFATLVWEVWAQSDGLVVELKTNLTLEINLEAIVHEKGKSLRSKKVIQALEHLIAQFELN